MLDRVLIATDGSDQADQALHMGGAIAARFNAEVIIVHVLMEEPTQQEVNGMMRLVRGLGQTPFAPLHVDDLVSGISDKSESSSRYTRQQALHEVGQSILRKAAETVRAEGVEAVRTDLLHGKASEAIVEAASAESADLVVLGNRGLGGIRSLLGSVSQHVSTHATASCLTVR